MVKSLVQLKRELAIEQRRAERLKVKAQLKAERSKLRFDLARIRHPGFFRAGRAITRGAISAGKGIRTQAILIKQLQERENRESRMIGRKIKKSSVIKKPRRKKKRLRIP